MDFVPKDVLIANPQFAKIIADLSQVLQKDGSSRSLADEWKKAQNEMKEEKKRFLFNTLIYDEMKEILEEHQHPSQGSRLTQRQEVYDVLNFRLSAEEASQSLKFFPQDQTSPTLLGLQRSDLQPMEGQDGDAKQKQGLRSSLIGELSQRFTAKYQSIHRFYDPLSDGPLNAKAFADRVGEDQIRLDEVRESIRSETASFEAIFWESFHLTEEFLRTISIVVEKGQLQHQFKSDEITSRWLQSRFSTMQKKLDVLRYQLLNETYTPDTVAALTLIHQHLDSTFKKALEDREDVTKRVGQYGDVGMGFEDLAKEYGELLKRIEDKKWTIEQLKGRTDHI
eukprot:TRINITY_DN5843_c0_g1_i1.p1 TRINITY_DN5843_c0_g1~~TRINITY_DN5843_c0_g1_i1.p1  ORF type:complete len:338 (+),score=81.66 TRINITY_DN5843_c0_g1_i1:8-1021(+)